MKILGTGLTGLIGSKIVEILGDKYEFENLSRSSGVDIINQNEVSERIKASDAQLVLHLAAKTNVDRCEMDRNLEQNGETWKVNVDGTRNVANTCEQTGKKVIYASTDFVFDGTKDLYFETDIPNPKNWYAQTKYEGEKIIQELETPWIIARIAYPYRANFKKPDFFRAILNKLKEGESVVGVADHIFTPTYVDDIATALDVLITGNSEGIFHVVGSQSLSPYDAANMIADEFDLDKSKIQRTTRSEFFKGRANRPFQLALENAKITKLGVRMRTFEEGLKEIKLQLSS